MKKIFSGQLFYAFAKAYIIIILLASCKNQEVLELREVSGKQLSIDEKIVAVDSIDRMIQPYREKMEAGMDEVLTYAPIAMHKNDTPLNTAIGNMMADVVRQQVSPIYKERTGNNIDIVLLNHGGIRAALAAGPVTTRDAYQIMPFENKIVVAELSSEKTQEMIDYLASGKKAHPFDGMQIHLDVNKQLKSALINDQPLDKNKSYRVATSDYLYNGGDNMTFFADTQVVDTDYKLRNAMIDFFKKTDTLRYSNDDRFKILKQ